MSNSQKISQMTAATTPLSGSELVPIVQSGQNRKVTVEQLGAVNNLQYQGTWNASTNTPALTSSVGTAGYYYIVDVAGTTTLNGISSWGVGDWAVFSNTGVWQQIIGGAVGALQVANDSSSNTNYNVVMSNVVSGTASTVYVDNTALTFNPITNKLDCAGQVEAANFGIPGCANYVLYWGAVENRLTLANYNADGVIMFEVNGGAYTARWNADGTYQFFNLYATAVTASPRALYVDSAGIIGYVTSTRASKMDIAPLASADWLSTLTAVTFKYRKKDEAGAYTDEANSGIEYGLIAEEVEAANPDLCMYDADGKLTGVKYERLVVPLLKKVQDLEARLAALEARN
jgi:hypothetical protein